MRLAAIGERRGLAIELIELIGDVPPFREPADSELVRVAEELTGHSVSAVNFATEAPFLHQLGMQTLVLGPGSIDSAHQPDEYLELARIEPCVELLQQFIARYCL